MKTISQSEIDDMNFRLSDLEKKYSETTKRVDDLRKRANEVELNLVTYLLETKGYKIIGGTPSGVVSAYKKETNIDGKRKEKDIKISSLYSDRITLIVTQTDARDRDEIETNFYCNHLTYDDLANILLIL